MKRIFELLGFGQQYDSIMNLAVVYSCVQGIFMFAKSLSCIARWVSRFRSYDQIHSRLIVALFSTPDSSCEQADALRQIGYSKGGW